MKQLSLLCLCLLFGISIQAQKGLISKEEKTFLIDFLNQTELELINTTNAVDQQTWETKPSPTAWSMSQCMQHILQAEKGLMLQIKATMEKPGKKDQDLRAKDAWLIAKIADRGVKVKTPLEEDLPGITKEEAINQLKTSRAAIRTYLNKKQALRSHFGRSPYGPADAYQLFLVIAAHSMRHHAQMQEILGDLAKS